MSAQLSRVLRRVGVGQLTATSDHASNLAAASQLCRQAKSAGACLLCLPEAFSFIGAAAAETVAQAEPLDGPRLGAYRALAREHGLWLSLGGFHEAGAPGGRVFNTHVVLDAAGATRAEYRKIHLFDVDVPDGPVLMESRSTAPGAAACVVVDASDELGFTFGLTTCYDLRFPELYVALARSSGCHAILAPSAFTRPTGAAHWHLLLRARAVESQAYVLAAAQSGTHNEKRASYGARPASADLRAVAVEAPGAARGAGADEFVRRRALGRGVRAAPPADLRALARARGAPVKGDAVHGCGVDRAAARALVHCERVALADGRVARAPLPADMAFLEDADARRDLRRDGSTTCFREVHGAADGAPPNLAVDRYGSHLLVQRPEEVSARATNVAAALGGASRTLSVDCDRKWLAYEAKSLAYNGVANPTVDVGGRPFPKHDAIYGDCFAWLRRLANRGETFDVVMLDPPSTSTVNGKRWSAQRDYGALAALCAPLVNPDGGLLCCTTNARKLRPRKFARVCSAALDDFAADRGLSIVLDRVVPPAVDYPVLAGQSPEVKNLVFRFERR
ncbi:bis(5'-adenosyl)-triphosphatase [Aureococcus anophagefferens]|uniref:Bis(5'-adenosyl)-triphosphatase n=1 Tax=Aureococcus anophagefferens TaxID=44056 RepID=A0ABR1G3B9_AURAN